MTKIQSSWRLQVMCSWWILKDKNWKRMAIKLITLLHWFFTNSIKITVWKDIKLNWYWNSLLRKKKQCMRISEHRNFFKRENSLYLPDVTYRICKKECGICASCAPVSRKGLNGVNVRSKYNHEWQPPWRPHRKFQGNERNFYFLHCWCIGLK